MTFINTARPHLAVEPSTKTTGQVGSVNEGQLDASGLLFTALVMGLCQLSRYRLPCDQRLRVERRSIGDRLPTDKRTSQHRDPYRLMSEHIVNLQAGGFCRNPSYLDAIRRRYRHKNCRFRINTNHHPEYETTLDTANEKKEVRCVITT